MAKRDKRVLALACLHCGSLVGLTPPAWWLPIDTHMTETRNLQKEMWTTYRRMLRQIGTVDVAIVDGDAIDGKAWRQGGRRLNTADRHEQKDMARSVLSHIDTKEWVVVPGTGYHTGKLELFERELAKDLGAQFKLRAFLDINGSIWDVRHKIGGSSIPHGRLTALLREKLWNQLWAARKNQPEVNVTLRAHVHYHIGAFRKGWVGMTLPALQAPATEYGQLDCSGTVDWGMVLFEVTKKGNVGWDDESYIVGLEGAKVKPIEL